MTRYTAPQHQTRHHTNRTYSLPALRFLYVTLIIVSLGQHLGSSLVSTVSHSSCRRRGMSLNLPRCRFTLAACISHVNQGPYMRRSIIVHPRSTCEHLVRASSHARTHIIMIILGQSRAMISTHISDLRLVCDPPQRFERSLASPAVHAQPRRSASSEALCSAGSTASQSLRAVAPRTTSALDSGWYQGYACKGYACTRTRVSGNALDRAVCACIVTSPKALRQR